MKAIRASALFLGLGLALLGCAPDLEREAGGLEIRWLGVSREADTLRATVTRGERNYATEAPSDRAGGVLSVESVPAGPVTVLGEALRAGAVLQNRLGAGEVPAGGLGVVVIDLGNPGNTTTPPASVDSVELSALIADLSRDDVTGDDHLLADAPLDPVSYDRFLSSAEETLTHAITALSVTGVHILIANLDQVQALDDLWLGSISVRLQDKDSAASVEIGRSDSVPEATALELTPTGDSLAPVLPALLSKRFDVVIDGPKENSGSDDFHASVTIWISLRAS